jgi:hypothetical protein
MVLRLRPEGNLVMSFDKLVESLIKEAQERGEFDNLPGKGKPIDLSEASVEWLPVKKQQKRPIIAFPQISFVKTLLTVLMSALQITSALLYFRALDLTFVAPKRHLFWNNRQ